MHTNPVRDRLQQRRAELSVRTDQIGSDLRGEAAQVEGSFADHAVVHANDAVLEAIRESAQNELQQIDHALRRIDEGRYERCETCGKPIGRERLEAVPYASTCMDCAD
jgi:DnaK suppressor protein